MRLILHENATRMVTCRSDVGPCPDLMHRETAHQLESRTVDYAQYCAGIEVKMVRGTHNDVREGSSGVGRRLAHAVLRLCCLRTC